VQTSAITALLITIAIIGSPVLVVSLTVVAIATVYVLIFLFNFFARVALTLGCVFANYARFSQVLSLVELEVLHEVFRLVCSHVD